MSRVCFSDSSSALPEGGSVRTTQNSSPSSSKNVPQRFNLPFALQQITKAMVSRGNSAVRMQRAGADPTCARLLLTTSSRAAGERNTPGKEGAGEEG